MNIKTFVEQSEREFQEKFPAPIYCDFNNHDDDSEAIKSFTSSKLRELIGEVRSHLNGRIGLLRQWINEKPSEMLVTNEDIAKWLELHLLDEAGGGK